MHMNLGYLSIITIMISTFYLFVNISSILILSNFHFKFFIESTSEDKQVVLHLNIAGKKIIYIL